MISSESFDKANADHFMLGELFPLAVCSGAHFADEFPTISTKLGSSSRCFGTFLTVNLLWLFYFLKSILNLKKVVDVEGCLEARHVSSWGKEGG